MAARTPAACTLRLSDGRKLTVSHGEAKRVYEELWLLVGAVRGALSAAAKVMEANERPLIGFGTTLDQNESELVTHLLAKVRSHAA